MSVDAAADATYSRVLPSRAERQLAARLTQQDSEITRLWDSLRAAQLGTSSLTGTMPIRDSSGVLVGMVGVQPDGTSGITVQNSSPPPRPAQAILTPFAAGLSVGWNGDFAAASRPLNFRNVEIYISPVASFIPGPSNFIGTLAEAGSIPVAPLPYVPHYAILIATNLAEDTALVGTGARATASAPSLASAGATPTQVVADAVLNGIVGNLALADDAVTQAKIAAGSVTETKVAPGAITSPLIAAGTIQGVNIAAQTIYGSLIASDAVDARILRALSVTADAMSANSILAGSIAAGAVTASKLESDLVLATRIVAGTLGGNRVEIHPTMGIQAFGSGGTLRTFFVNASTGALTAVGTMATAFSGSRIELNPGGNNPDSIRLYQGSNYAEIFADPAGGGAGVFMAGNGASRGKAVAYNNECAVSWQDSTPVSRSACSCTSTGVGVWGGSIDLNGRAQWGTGIVQFSYRDSGGTFQGVRTLQYKGAGSGEPALFSPNFDTQIVWLSNGLTVQSAAGVSKNFIGASSRRVKKAERPMAFGDLSPLDLVRALEPKRWNYEGEWIDGEPEPPRRKIRRRGEQRRDDRDRLVEDAPDEVVDAPPPVKAKPHYGLMAEDVVDIAPDLVVHDESLPGGLGLVDRDLIAVLWHALRQLARIVVAAQRAAAVPSVAATAPGPDVAAGAGSLFERAGTLWYRNSAGVERALTLA